MFIREKHEFQTAKRLKCNLKYDIALMNKTYKRQILFEEIVYCFYTYHGIQNMKYVYF